jgi:hypothetical protein
MSGAALQATGLPTAEAVTGGSLSAAPSSSWQSNGTVWKMVYAHGDIFMIGDFTTLRPPGAAPGTRQRPALRFAAVKASTGAPDPAVKVTHRFTGQSSGLPLTNGAIAASPDGNTIYVGGSFTRVDGQFHAHVAAFDASTGALLPSFTANVGGKVSAIATAGDVVYLGGAFGRVGPTPVGPNLAAVSASTGAVLGWGAGPPPSTNGTVDALAVSRDNSQVIAGGYFDRVDGLTGSADATTTYSKAVIIGAVGSAHAGQLERMTAEHVVPPGTNKANAGCSSNVKDVVVSGAVAYLANEGTGGGCFDGTWAVNLPSGSLKWVDRCLGASQVVAVVGRYLYKGSHAHDCQAQNRNGDPDNFPQLPPNQPRHLLSENLATGYLGPWYPLTNAGGALGPRAMATDGHQLYVGGDFTSINHRPQQGIARFTAGRDFPTPRPPAPTAVAGRLGQVTITALPPVDLDDPDLTLQLFRAGRAKPIAAAHVHSLFWRRPRVAWVDRGAVPGSTVSYRVRAVETHDSGGSPLSPASVAVDVACAVSDRIHAAVVSVAARRVAHRRSVQVQICSAAVVRVSATVVRGRRVLARLPARRMHPGHAQLTLPIKRRVHAGRIRAVVVFAQHARRKVSRQTLYLPR